MQDQNKCDVYKIRSSAPRANPMAVNRGLLPIRDTNLLVVKSHAKITDALNGLFDVRLLVSLDVDVALYTLGRHHRFDLQWLILIGESDELGHQLQDGGTLLADPALDHPEVRVSGDERRSSAATDDTAATIWGHWSRIARYTASECATK